MSRLGSVVSAARSVREVPRCARAAQTAAVPREAASQPLSQPLSQAEWAEARPYADIPGPRSLPGLGNVWRFLPGIGEFHGMDSGQLFTRLREKYGPICKLGGMPGRPDLLLVHNAEDIELIYRTEGVWPTRRVADSLEHYFRDLRKGRLVSLASSHGEEWAKFRSAVNPVMMQPRSTAQYVGPIDQVAQELVDRMKSRRDAKGLLPEDFMTELNKWSIESIALVSLDTRLGCLRGDLDPASDAAVMIRCNKEVLASVEKLDIKPSPWKFISTPAYRNFISNMDLFMELSTKHVMAAMDRLQKLSAEEMQDRQHSVLENLLVRTGDPGQAVSMALDMLLAGIDTTSTVTATVLYQLAINPDKQKLLQAELDRAIPDPSKPVTKEQLEELKYLRACVKETMRIMPILLANFRDTGKDIVLSGYQVPQGTITVMPSSVASRSEAYYPRANEFLPERWLRDNRDESLDAANAFAFLPFGLGPRMCVGKRFAQLEIETLVSKVFRNLTLEWNQPPAVTEFRTLLTFKSPLLFTVKDRP